MNDYKKISIVNEYNEKTGEWDVKTIVIFRNNGSPVIEDFEDDKHLKIISDFMKASNLSVLNGDFKKACDEGLVAVLSRTNEKDMADLNSEILKEQIKYHNKDLNNVFNQEVEKQNILSKEDQELLQYFKLLNDKKRKERLAADGVLPPVGFEALKKNSEEIGKLSKINERVAVLEDAANRLKEGTISENEYNKVYDTYRAQLADAIKNISGRDDTKAKENQELLQYFKLLNNKKRKERLAADGVLPPVGFEDIKKSNEEISKLAKVNERVAALEDAANRLKEGTISENEYNKIYDTYRAQLADFIENNNQNKVNSSKIMQKSVNNGITPPIAPITSSVENRRNVTPVAPVSASVENRRNVTPVAPVSASVENRRNVTPVAPVSASVENRRNVTPVAPVSASEENVRNVIPVAPVTASDENVRNVIPVAPVSASEENVRNVTPVAPVSTSDENKKDTQTPGIKLNRNSNPVQTQGVINDNPEEIRVVPSGKEKITVRIKKAWKKVVAAVLALGAAIGAGFGIASLTRNKGDKTNSNIQHNQLVDSRSKLDSIITSYMNSMEVSSETRKFISQNSVMEFLSQYKSANQVKEVLSALCYGYEANMLNIEDGNFKLDEDGANRLRSFTNDFLCAKVVVNNYTPEQMLSVFGGTSVSYEQLMDGFKSYCTTLSIYGTTATKTPPFRYLTNGDVNATKSLTDLFDKLSNVNKCRDLGILDSTHTDAFIVAVDDFFVHNDQKLKLSEGVKTVAASIVDSYIYMQANIANGEALYLHEDHGLSKAGINLVNASESELDGTVISRNKDSLLNVINHLYADDDLVNARCLTAKQVLLENLNAMHGLANSPIDNQVMSFANLLYQNGLKEYGDEVSKGNYSLELLSEISMINPTLNSEISSFEQALVASNSSYVPFETTVNGVDSLLGIKGLVNNIAPLINTRMDISCNYDNYRVVSGKRYVTNARGNNNLSSNYSSTPSVPSSTTTTTTTEEQVQYSDLSQEEKQEASNKIEQLQEQQQEQQKQQEEAANQAAQDIINQVQSGSITTQEEAQQLADKVGMTLEPGLVETIKDLHDNPELTEKIDQEYADKNAALEEQSNEQKRQEEARQQEELNDMLDLISQGGDSSSQPEESEVLSPDIDYSDPDINAGMEQPYQPDSSSQESKETLAAIRELLTNVDPNGLVDEAEVNNSLDNAGPRL